MIQKRIRLALIAILGVSILTSMVLAWATPDTAAQGPPLPTPTSVPSGGGSSGGSDDDDNGNHDRTPIGAYIVLQVQPARLGLWAVVQWQDAIGNWHDVEGWRGNVVKGTKVWWVAETDFGKGPFRWVIYQNKGGKLLLVSASFYLPDNANETVRVEVSLKP